MAAKRNKILSEALQKETWEEALDYLRENRPRDVLMHGHRFEKTYHSIKIRKVVPRPERPERVFNREFETDFSQSLIFIGEWGLGKTEYAKYHFKNPIIVSQLEDLKQLDDHDGIVFEDMDFKHLPSNTQRHLTDMGTDSSIRIRYGYGTTPAMTKRIFTCSQYPFIEDPGIDWRVRVLRLQDSLKGT